MDENFLLADKSSNLVKMSKVEKEQIAFLAQNVSRKCLRFGLSYVGLIVETIGVQELLPQVVIIGARNIVIYTI